ncbi:MAG TPA: hypothetical protein VM888_12075, partial [Chitinophagaceae bacterium]|nr:hypothetical protein [Chitinophagaceae bacterium]
NAVKHGLKKVKEIGYIKVEAAIGNTGLIIRIFDNGPDFPDKLVAGYGMKHVMDKLELIYPQAYELAFINEPQKHILIIIKKRVKHEATMEGVGN